ncbi:hypothetical protein HNR42_003429 [Deinobacterium chartae]|uniref:Lipoprotein n=1 Tax=Deinobacterium chartae TaxID=521158 RepID=A0A841I669_9DEIO|nr:hypothetical protein [Deinobacterium chartae]MBB6099968.1 hypothetical protein [Deinobacterium chartae]
MKRYGFLALAALLGACAPSQTAPFVAAPLIDLQSGQASTIYLYRNGGAGVSGRQRVEVAQPGGLRLEGEYNVLQTHGVVHVEATSRWWGFGFQDTSSSVLGQGSLVARGANVVLSCDFTVENGRHANGTCSDNQGRRYKFSF